MPTARNRAGALYACRGVSTAIDMTMKTQSPILNISAGTPISQKQLSAIGAEQAAEALIGKLLCKKNADGTVLRARITETECYCGEEDTACHAHKGKTPRNSPLYEAGGISYVYLCYGIHSLLNIITGKKDHPEGVLIRGIEGASGPGRVTKALGITLSDNTLPLTPENGLWLEDDGYIPSSIQKLPRVGIDYAEESDRLRPWRFLDAFSSQPTHSNRTPKSNPPTERSNSK